MNEAKPPVIACLALGCKTNQYEMDALRDEAIRHGFVPGDPSEPADVYVLNTCTVTAEAGRKSRQMLRRFRRLNPKALIVACGCQSARADLSAWCDLAIGTHGRAGLFSEIAARLGREVTAPPPVPPEIYEELPGLAVPNETRAHLKIQDGCNRRCAYCAIAPARGRARSRRPDAVLAEAQALVARGFTELVLTGTHLCSYGCDAGRRGEEALLDLLRALDAVDGLERVRLGSVDAGLLTPAFIAGYAELKTPCPHFHLSLQSGSDRILRAMRRPDTQASFMDAVSRLREVMPTVGLTADIIVGFPGETDEDFDATRHLCEEAAFLRIHVFRFSAREGTPAYAMAPVDPAVIRERAATLQAQADRQAEAAIVAAAGHMRDIIAERTDEAGMVLGYTGDYLAAVTRPAGPIRRGERRAVRVERARGSEALCVDLGPYRS